MYFNKLELFTEINCFIIEIIPRSNLKCLFVLLIILITNLNQLKSRNTENKNLS